MAKARAFKTNLSRGQMWRTCSCAMLLSVLFPFQTATGAEKAEDSVAIMAGAARTLEFSVKENRAFMLVKQETVVAEVAIIFGYADNEAACKQIAQVLTDSGVAGSFKCNPIY